MEDLNTISLIGRLTKDPELKQMSNGSSRMDFSVAFNTTKKVGNDWQDEANFLNLSLWGKQAEALSKFLTKGKQVAILGHLKQERWEKDGQKQSALKVVIDQIQLLGGKGSGSTNNAAETFDSGFPEDCPF